MVTKLADPAINALKSAILSQAATVLDMLESIRKQILANVRSDTNPAGFFRPSLTQSLKQPMDYMKKMYEVMSV